MNGGKINIKGSRIKTNEHQIIIALREKVLEFCVEPHTVKEILDYIDRTNQYRNVLVPKK